MEYLDSECQTSEDAHTIYEMIVNPTLPEINPPQAPEATAPPAPKASLSSEQQAYCSHTAPEDWNEPDAAYNPVLVAIWREWLVAEDGVKAKHPKPGKKVTSCGPLLPWFYPDQANLKIIILWLNFCPERLNNALKGEHPAGSYRTKGNLKSECWQMKLESLGSDCYCVCIKLNAIPYLIPYGGKKTDVFSAEDVADIDRLYASFTKKVLELTAAKNLLGSKKVEDWVAKSLGGTVKFEKYVKSNSSRFFTVDNIVSFWTTNT